MILVIGGRSKIGSALIEILAARGVPVRALTRSGEDATYAPGVEVVRGDLADRASLDAALDGVDRLFLLCGPNPEEVALNRNAIDAARDANVRLLVRSSILGAEPQSLSTFIRHHGECDAYLRGAGVGYAIVKPNLFAQNIPETTIPSIDENGVFYANAGEARISMVDTRDVGAVAASVLTDPGLESVELDVTGPEALSYGDVAGKLTRALGREISYVDVPDDAVAQALQGFGPPDWMVRSLVELFQDYRRSGTDGYAARVTDTVARLTGRRARTLDDLLGELRPAPAGAIG